MLAQIGDDHPLQYAAQIADDVEHQVMRHGPGRLRAVHPPVNRQRLADADADGKRPLTALFPQYDNLLFAGLLNNNPR